MTGETQPHLANDVVHYERGTRQVAHAAAQRIEVITEQLKSLPIPSDSPAPDVQELPIPARTPAPDAATLPRAVQSSDHGGE